MPSKDNITTAAPFRRRNHSMDPPWGVAGLRRRRAFPLLIARPPSSRSSKILLELGLVMLGSPTVHCTELRRSASHVVIG
jgi:hypothetical protein